MTENKLQAWCVQICKEYAILCYKTIAVGRRGFPDLTLVLPGGVVVFVELKTLIGRLSPLQVRTIKKLKEQGANVEVINCRADFTDLLAHYTGAAGGDRASV